MINRGMFTSYKQDWKTPKKIYEDLNSEFNFDFDPCPADPQFDGLEVEWGKSNYVNPPYTTKLQDAFTKKAVEEFKKGKTVVMLIPARTDTMRFHDLILPHATEIRFIKRRLQFDDCGKDASFGSMIIIFSNKEASS